MTWGSYRWRAVVRRRLPWFLLNLGIAKKIPDCSTADGDHEWYNLDDARSGCYHCDVVRPGRLWEALSVRAARARAVPTREAGPTERQLATACRESLDRDLGGHYEIRVVLYRINAGA